MAETSTYLHFKGQTEEAFNLYKEAFGTEFIGPVARHGDMTGDPSNRLIVNIRLPILGGHLLMGADIFEGMNDLVLGNNSSIALLPDNRDDADRLFAALSEGGTTLQPMQDAPWGDYWGWFIDRFGVQWMINHTPAG